MPAPDPFYVNSGSPISSGFAPGYTAASANGLRLVKVGGGAVSLDRSLLCLRNASGADVVATMTALSDSRDLFNFLHGIDATQQLWQVTVPAGKALWLFAHSTSTADAAALSYTNARMVLTFSATAGVDALAFDFEGFAA